MQPQDVDGPMFYHGTVVKADAVKAGTIGPLFAGRSDADDL